MNNNIFTELGNLGSYRWGGYVYEEFLHDLRGKKGIETYKEMSENDDITGAILFAMEMLIRQVKWDVLPQGPSHADNQAANFVLSCMHDMDHTWTDFISEVLSFLTYGWSYHEIVYKRRMGNSKHPQKNSKYSDGLIGWRKLPIRSQDTLSHWVFDSHDNLKGLVQSAPPNFENVFIPIEKALHFKTKNRKGNPEGRSILRNAYRTWYFKRRIQEIEGIGIERDLAGLPVISAPEGANIWDPYDDEAQKMRTEAELLVRSIRRDEREGVLLPSGWNLQLLSTGGRRQFDTNSIIERYDNRIAMSVLADFVLLGHQSVGSFALSSDKTKLFAAALGTFLNIICEVFNKQAIPRLININRLHFNSITDYPQLIHGDIETQDLDKLGSFVKNMVKAGTITPDEPLEDYLRMTADLPPRSNSNNKSLPNTPLNDFSSARLSS